MRVRLGSGYDEGEVGIWMRIGDDVWIRARLV